MTDALPPPTHSIPQIELELQRRRQLRIRQFFKDDGPYRRELYPKHMAFLEAGRRHRERLMLKANRVGGTLLGAMEVTLHLTGLYDQHAPWWPGRRFNGPIRCWCAGDTGKTTRDIQQRQLFGEAGQMGTGMVPADTILKTTAKSGVPDGLETVMVRHVSGGISELQLKSFAEGRISFQGTSQHVIWIDEQVPDDVYAECVLRTMETSDFEGGMIILTYTPLLGLTSVTQEFLKEQREREAADEVARMAKAIDAHDQVDPAVRHPVR